MSICIYVYIHMQETEKTVRRRGNKLFQGLLEGEEVGAL